MRELGDSVPSDAERLAVDDGSFVWYLKKGGDRSKSTSSARSLSAVVRCDFGR